MTMSAIIYPPMIRTAESEMSNDNIAQNAILEHQAAVSALNMLLPEIITLAERMRSCLSCGGKIVWMGNGGSAADCQHLAAEMVGRFRRERSGLASIALTTDSSILTSIGNDYGFDYIYARQVEALCQPHDLLIGISTSGNSRNVITAIEAGKKLGIYTIGLLGANGGKMRDVCDFSLIAPATDTPRIQEVQILIGHILCELVESAY